MAERQSGLQRFHNLEHIGMKLKTPTELVAHYKIATPMFLGGGDQKADKTQFRNASFKGALRFWWRALNWGAALKDAGNQQAAALSLLHEREGKLFGLASDGKNSKQSCVQIHSELRGATVPKNNLPEHAYLLGIGLYRDKEGMRRDYLQGGNLAIRLTFKLNAKEEDIASVQQAAIALGLFGGLGSRSRRGFGSLALQKIERPGQPEREFTTIESITDFIQSLDFSAPSNAPLSAFTKGTRIDVSATAGKALDALTAIGKELQMYRSFGKDGQITLFEHSQRKVVPAHPKFRADHDNVRSAIQGARLEQLPTRAVFGLPHNYFFSSIKEGDNSLDITAQNPESAGQETDGRRASPLLVHIHPLKDGKFIAIQTLLPEVFLPQGVGLSAKVGLPKKKKRPVPAPRETTVDYTVITRYLDGFVYKETLKAPHHG